MTFNTVQWSLFHTNPRKPTAFIRMYLHNCVLTTKFQTEFQNFRSWRYIIIIMGPRDFMTTYSNFKPDIYRISIVRLCNLGWNAKVRSFAQQSYILSRYKTRTNRQFFDICNQTESVFRSGRDVFSNEK